MTALFFANDKRFEPLKNRLIKEGVFKESDLLIFTLSKETMLREFYP
ncbi:putative exported domain protein [Yersinia pestis PY-09]|nr:putative exported domain protein [Yersinia pestis PY-09]